MTALLWNLKMGANVASVFETVCIDTYLCLWSSALLFAVLPTSYKSKKENELTDYVTLYVTT